MKRCGKLVSVCLCAALLLSGCGLAMSEKEAAAQAYCEEFVEAMVAGDWAAVQNRLLLPGVLGDAPQEEKFAGGAMEAMMERMEVAISSSDEQGDGSVRVKMKITAVDFEKLLGSLPEDISSKEEARAAMKELVKDARTKSFDAEVTLVPDADGAYQVEIDGSFANAVTGGMLDLLTKAWKEAGDK